MCQQHSAGVGTFDDPLSIRSNWSDALEGPNWPERCEKQVFYSKDVGFSFRKPNQVTEIRAVNNYNKSTSLTDITSDTDVGTVT